jgi:hypothetical protein
MPIPRNTSAAETLIPFHQPGLKRVERILKVQADAVIIHQKLIYGAVAGRNIMLHNMAAKTIVKISFFIFS